MGVSPRKPRPEAERSASVAAPGADPRGSHIALPVGGHGPEPARKASPPARTRRGGVGARWGEGPGSSSPLRRSPGPRTPLGRSAGFRPARTKAQVRVVLRARGRWAQERDAHAAGAAGGRQGRLQPGPSPAEEPQRRAPGAAPACRAHLPHLPPPPPAPAHPARSPPPGPARPLAAAVTGPRRSMRSARSARRPPPRGRRRRRPRHRATARSEGTMEPPRRSCICMTLRAGPAPRPEQ
uniref:Proline-rich protein 2-like n=1 Tax=Callorhinus ursinus TaxID=34884 RepID=A0A3Q7MPF6_CALUR|nr:proline-rich protein 2-like [Callorhinus ursinus]